MNKENSSKKANSVVRSPYKTRSYTKAQAKKTVEKVKTIKKKSETNKEVSSKKSDTSKSTKNSQTKKISKPVVVQALSDDTLQHIFEYLGPYDTIWNARRVCRKWNEIAKKVSFFNCNVVTFV